MITSGLSKILIRMEGQYESDWIMVYEDGSNKKYYSLNKGHPIEWETNIASDKETATFLKSLRNMFLIKDDEVITREIGLEIKDRAIKINKISSL